MNKEPIITLWKFKFVVRAGTLEDALKKLKDTTGVNATHNDSEREINGLYVISHMVNESELSKDFYRKIMKSEDIAIHSDTKSASLYPKILAEVQAVEDKLRWLLLHVSDAIDNFANQISKKGPEKNSDIITKKSLDPITSTISFEAMLELLGLDQSWARDGISDERMRLLIIESADFADFKKSYIDRTTQKTTWESISSLVLKKSVPWESLEDYLHKIRGYRNKCAHFKTVTDDDLLQAQYLSKKLDSILEPKKTIPSRDVALLKSLNDSLARSLESISRMYSYEMNRAAMEALSRIDTTSLTERMNKAAEMIAPTDTVLRAAEKMIPRIDIPQPSQRLMDALNRSFSAMQGYNTDSSANDTEEVSGDEEPSGSSDEKDNEHDDVPDRGKNK